MADKLFAILHDGNFNGDSVFYSNDFIDYDSNMTLKNMSEAFWKLRVEEDGDTYQRCKEIYPITGAWIVDQKGVDAIKTVWDKDEENDYCMSDSTLYQLNRSTKKLAAKLAIKTLGLKAT